MGCAAPLSFVRPWIHAALGTGTPASTDSAVAAGVLELFATRGDPFAALCREGRGERLQNASHHAVAPVAKEPENAVRFGLRPQPRLQQLA